MEETLAKTAGVIGTCSGGQVSILNVAEGIPIRYNNVPPQPIRRWAVLCYLLSFSAKATPPSSATLRSLVEWRIVSKCGGLGLGT